MSLVRNTGAKFTNTVAKIRETVSVGHMNLITFPVSNFDDGANLAHINVMTMRAD